MSGFAQRALSTDLPAHITRVPFALYLKLVDTGVARGVCTLAGQFADADGAATLVGGVPEAVTGLG